MKATEFLKSNDFITAVNVALKNGKISIALLHRNMSIGYGTACVFIRAMNELGIIEPTDDINQHRVVIDSEKWLEILKNNDIDI